MLPIAGMLRGGERKSSGFLSSSWRRAVFLSFLDLRACEEDAELEDRFRRSFYFLPTGEDELEEGALRERPRPFSLRRRRPPEDAEHGH